MTVIVDSKLLYYEENHKHRPTLGLFDTLAVMLQRIEDETMREIKNIIMVYDIGKSLYRQTLWPHYKAKRVYSHLPASFKTTYELQVPRIAKALGMCNFPIHGVEADDLAGILCNKLKEDIILVSGDGDWGQIVLEHGDRVRYFYVKKWQLQDKAFIASTSGCYTPEQFLIKKASTDDIGDNIRGIPSIGPVKFKKWSEEAFKLPDSQLKESFITFCKSTKKGTHKDYHDFGIQTCEELYDFNMQLGRIMSDLSLLTLKQKTDIKVCHTMMRDRAFDEELAQRIVSEHSDGFLGPFGDPFQLSPVSLAYYKEVYNRKDT